jgi:flagellar motor switch protein FliG
VDRSTRILPILFAAAAISWTQGPGPAAHGSRTLADDRARLAHGYERTIHDALVRYFADNTFLVRAHVEFDDPDDMDVDARGNSASTLPALPGLPYQPYDLKAPTTSPDERIHSVYMDVLVDTAYNQKDRDFIQYLVTVAANLDTARGDELHVQRAVFPRDDRAFRKTMPAPEALVKDTEAGPDTVRVSPPKTLREEFLERLIWILPLLVVCLFCLAALWLLRKPAMRRIPGAMKARFRKGSRGGDDDDPPSQGPVDEEESPKPKSSRQALPPTTAMPLATDPSSLRPFLVNSFVGEPRVCGQILRSWLDRDPSKGLKDAGLLFAGGSSKLLELVRESLGEQWARSLDAKLASGEEVVETEFVAAASEFRREFRNATMHQADSRDGDLFGFLEQLNEAQIMHILKDEPLGISGFALAQVTPAKAGSILQKLDAPTRARLMYAIGNVTQVPRDVYKQVADRLSLKAMDVANMKFVAADGVESLVHLIENLPVDQQFQYIHSLSEVDLNLAKKVRKRTITFPELASLPDKFLSTGIQAVDPETLALVLPALDQEQRARFLSLLPERMRLLLQSAMETQKSATPSDVEAAQNRLLRTFREEIRRNGRPS